MKISSNTKYTEVTLTQSSTDSLPYESSRNDRNIMRRYKRKATINYILSHTEALCISLGKLQECFRGRDSRQLATPGTGRYKNIKEQPHSGRQTFLLNNKIMMTLII